MCAQRKPAVKDAKRQVPARAPEQQSRQVRPAGTTAKAPSTQKNQEKSQNAFQRWMERIGQIIRDTRSEIKKVTWPDRETTRKLTLLVIGVSIVLGLLLGGIDYFLLKLFEAV
jgi:preprotein translocase subunit SecE